MKCPKCDLVTFDHLAKCPRCKASFARERRLTRRRSSSKRSLLLPRPGRGASEDAGEPGAGRSPRVETAPSTGAEPPKPTESPEPEATPPTAAAKPEADAEGSSDRAGDEQADTNRAREVVRRRAESESESEPRQRQRSEIQRARETVQRQDRTEGEARGRQDTEEHGERGSVDHGDRDAATVHASPPPSAEEHEADAQRIKNRMVRAGRVRRQRDKVQVAEVDPVLPDWYEPSLDEDDEEDEPPARKRSLP